MNKLNVFLVLLEIALFLGVPLIFKPSEILWIYMLTWTLTMPISFIMNKIDGFVKISYLLLICITIVNIIRFTCFINNIDFSSFKVSYLIDESVNIEWWLPLIGYIIGDLIENIYSEKTR